MSIQKDHIMFALGGFLLGTLGLKAIKSQPAKKLAVNVVAQGLKMKSGCEGVFEEAKARFGDIVAEAGYLNDSGNAAAASKPKSPARPAKSK
ncbi:MAG: DUF6110 family protein [Candidatus Accumulibacter sp.]|jgi:hypothetical protein|nr:DUF6110 family protein [Accumulibacter sp.]